MSDTKPNPYTGYDATRLRDTHAYWESIIRAAKNPAQRARAVQGSSWAAELLRKAVA